MGRSWLLVVPFLLAFSEIKAKPTLSMADLGPKISKMVEPLRAACVPKSGITDEAINKVINGEFADDPVLKTYMRCLLDESGVMDDKGELIMDMIVDMIPPKIAVQGLKNVKICDARRKNRAFFKFKLAAFTLAGFVGFRENSTQSASASNIPENASIKDINDKTFAFFKCFYDLNPDMFIFF